MIDHERITRTVEAAEAVHAAKRAVHRAQRFAPAAELARTAVLLEAYRVCSALGYSQRGTAELLGLSKSTLNRIVGGELELTAGPDDVHAEALLLAQRAWREGDVAQPGE